MQEWEKLNDLEVFILIEWLLEFRNGDVLSFIEKAQANIDEKAQELEKKIDLNNLPLMIFEIYYSR